jgi:hypothetical protein
MLSALSKKFVEPPAAPRNRCDQERAGLGSDWSSLLRWIAKSRTSRVTVENRRTQRELTVGVQVTRTPGVASG